MWSSYTQVQKSIGLVTMVSHVGQESYVVQLCSCAEVDRVSHSVLTCRTGVLCGPVIL